MKTGLQVSGKGTSGGSGNSQGLVLEGSTGRCCWGVAKRRMRCEIQGPAKKVSKDKCLCL